MTQHEFNREVFEILSEIAETLYPNERHGNGLKSKIESLQYGLPVNQDGDDE